MILKILLGIVATLTVALFLASNAYLDQRDRNVKLNHQAEIARLTQEYVERQQTALAEITAKYTLEISTAEKEHKDNLNEIMSELATAHRDALQKPIVFGDRFIRDLIRIDCLRSLGKADDSKRQACRDEAATADPSKSIIPFSALTPTFIRGWGDACSARDDISAGTGDLDYSEQDWLMEFGSFDKALCSETIVALTPEGSLLLRNFLETSSAYEESLLNYAAEQNEIIDQLSQ